MAGSLAATDIDVVKAATTAMSKQRRIVCEDLMWDELNLKGTIEDGLLILFFIAILLPKICVKTVKESTVFSRKHRSHEFVDPCRVRGGNMIHGPLFPRADLSLLSGRAEPKHHVKILKIGDISNSVYSEPAYFVHSESGHRTDEDEPVISEDDYAPSRSASVAPSRSHSVAPSRSSTVNLRN
ncbi:uncharacterized protein EDB91DRAFT_1264952 [Suillus paluster]|uniref:uncharacterized protein n=1 Tax=Suillus paluster TaxID=48578 RepID=UPI001B879464|nr:uncharacterized protein EDB91DRAFT_1264952 [Suillus paluster]KAG1747243.1 hypothetical protein EDB91DRAFT_1264952 [Suillus paluster]